MYFKIAVSLLAILSINPAFAKMNVNGSAALLSAWGGGTLQLCKYNVNNGNVTDIGASVGKYLKGRGALVGKDGRQLEYAKLAVVARKVTDTGAYFCPTQIEGRREDKDRPNCWTDYVALESAANESSYCFWACLKGYTGKGCTAKAGDGSAIDVDTRNITKATYDNLVAVGSGDSLETGTSKDIFAFVGAKDDKCGTTAMEQQHDMILAVVGWTDYGVKVAPVTIRARRTNDDDVKKASNDTGVKKDSKKCKNGWGKKCATVYPIVYQDTASKDILACFSGYQQDATGTKCEIMPSAEKALAEQKKEDEVMSTGYCIGFPEAKYNSKIHTREKDNSANCYKYRCKSANMVFKDSTSFECIECTHEFAHKIVKTDAGFECLKCDNATQYINGDTCETGTAMSKTDLQYGKNKTKSNAKDKSGMLEADKLCWTARGDNYTTCIRTGTIPNASSGQDIDTESQTN